MKSRFNLPVLFVIAGLCNLLFLFDTLETDKKEEFYIFSCETSKSMSILYYSLVAMLLIGTGIYYLKAGKKQKNNVK